MFPQRVVSIHFPKAGGTSLRTQLARLLGDQLSLDYNHDPLTPAGRDSSEFPAGKRVVHGHFRATRYSATAAYFLTFLRDPVENLLSIYYFWRDFPMSDNPVHQRFLRERPSLIEFASYPGINRLMSQTYFGGFDMGRFDFIGFHDSRDHDLRVLGSELGLPIDPTIHENPTAASAERGQIENDRTTMLALHNLLRRDITFYETLKRTRC
jgi:hypothetical protein